MHDIQRSHEIVQVVLEAAREQGAERIERINLVIGELTFLSPDQVRFWVGELLKDTIGEGAEVVIETQRPKVRCRACGYEGEVAVEDDPIYHYSTMVPACPECGSTEMRQDEDVLDTWFSSWLWTFSPMGWPERTADLEKFHPTDVLVTGGDIIFFWVARMIMASLEFMGEIPFSDVYITGIVRDSKGRKMSKSLGNSPDMIDIIDRHGADAFRFSLMMLSPPGQDLLFDEKKLDVGKHFANKVWNAARFVLSQEEGESFFGGGGPAGEGEGIAALFEALFGTAPAGGFETGWEDEWIASRLAAAMAWPTRRSFSCSGRCIWMLSNSSGNSASKTFLAHSTTMPLSMSMSSLGRMISFTTIHPPSQTQPILCFSRL